MRRNRWKMESFILLLVGVIVLQLWGVTIVQAWAHSTQPAIVTLTPQPAQEVDNFQISAVLGRPNVAKNEVQADLSTATSPTQTATVSLPGGNHAAGTLWFFNESGENQTIPSTILTDSHGVAVTFQGPITVPVWGSDGHGGAVSVAAWAVNPGPAGNIPAFDFNGHCCGVKLLVRNATAFTGGLSGLAAPVLQQADIQAAAAPLLTALAHDAMSQLDKYHVTPGESLASSSLQCQPTLSANHAVGDRDIEALTLTGTVACREEEYDQQTTEVMAVRLLQREALRDRYALIPHFYLVIAPDETNGATIRLEVNVQSIGMWQFSPQDLQDITTQIAGQSQEQARTLLYVDPLIFNLQFGFIGNIPSDVAKIHLVVQDLALDLPPPSAYAAETIDCHAATTTITVHTLSCSQPGKRSN